MHDISVDRLKTLLCCIFCASILLTASSALSAISWLYSTISSSNVNSSMAKVGDTVTFTFITSEPITTPTVTVKSGGTTVAGIVTVVNISGNTWNASYVTSSSDTEGIVEFTVTAEDMSGGSSQLGSTTDFSSVTFDKSAPFISKVAAVPTPTSDNTPNYRFSSFEAGTIIYGGACTSTQTIASGGTTTVTFSMLADGTYSNCTIRVRDAAGNLSNTLTLASFTVNATAPVVEEVTPVPSPFGGALVSYTFSTTEAGTITYGGSCSSITTAAVLGNNTVQFLMPPNPPFTNGVIYDDCTIVVIDAQGSASSILAISPFIIDTTAPYVYEVSPVVSPTVDSTPTYVFNVDEAGTVVYGGACSSAMTDAVAGDNTVLFDTLPNGVYEDCTITLTDIAGNSSESLAVSTFTVATLPVDAVATKFVITDPTDTVVRRPVVISVQVLKGDDTVDTSYQQDVTLLVSGSATGAGLVDIINGVGTITITDAVVETVTLVLSDTEASGLDVSSTQDVVFRGGGGNQTLPTLVQFFGRAYPNARLSIVTKDKDQLVDTEVHSAIISNRDGIFTVTLSELPIKVNKTYGIAITDADGRASLTKFYTLEVLPEKTVSKIVFVPPTISAVQRIASKQGNVGFVGYMTPKNELSFELDGKALIAKPIVESSGYYSLSIGVGALAGGMHTIRATQRDGAGILSDPSLAATFTISDFIPATDLNGDGMVTISDWSIFLLIWGSDDTERKKRIDFNHDGAINISDLSIFIQTMK